MSLAVVGGRTVEYAEAGGGQRAVLLCAATWWPLDPWRINGFPELSGRFRTIAFNHRGVGRSSGSDPASYDLELFADDTLAFLDHLGLQRVAVVGFTIGSAIAVRLASRRPERISALVLGAVSPGAPPDSEDPRRVVDADIAAHGFQAHIQHHALNDTVAFRPETHAEHPERPRALAEALWRNAAPQAEFMKHVDARRGYDVFASAPHVKAPALLVVGEEEGPTRLRATQRLAEVLPEARLEVLPRTRHMVFWERPEIVWPDVVAFLETRA